MLLKQIGKIVVSLLAGIVMTTVVMAFGIAVGYGLLVIGHTADPFRNAFLVFFVLFSVVGAIAWYTENYL